MRPHSLIFIIVCFSVFCFGERHLRESEHMHVWSMSDDCVSGCCELDLSFLFVDRDSKDVAYKHFCLQWRVYHSSQPAIPGFLSLKA